MTQALVECPSISLYRLIANTIRYTMDVDFLLTNNEGDYDLRNYVVSEAKADQGNFPTS